MDLNGHVKGMEIERGKISNNATADTRFGKQRFGFRARSQNCERRLLASSGLSVGPHATTWLPLDGFQLNLVFEYLSKNIWLADKKLSVIVSVFSYRCPVVLQ
jgi:hypothetical protein